MSHNSLALCPYLTNTTIHHSLYKTMINLTYRAIDPAAQRLTPTRQNKPSYPNRQAFKNGSTIPNRLLYRGFPSSAAYVWFPFVTKLETRLRFGGLAYMTEQGAPPKGPRGKIPYLAISKTGRSDPRPFQTPL